jgi:DNA-binding NtrC family response regulator
MSKERILILDGEANSQWTLKALLENEDFSVIVANSIDQAFGNFAKNEFSGLITEYRVNHSLTLNVVREFKKAFPEAYVMMLSYGEVREGEYEEIINAGTDDFFQKPISLRRVLLHLQKGLKNRLNLLSKKGSVAEMNTEVTNLPISQEAIDLKIQSVV